MSSHLKFYLCMAQDLMRNSNLSSQHYHRARPRPSASSRCCRRTRPRRSEGFAGPTRPGGHDLAAMSECATSPLLGLRRPGTARRHDLAVLPASAAGGRCLAATRASPAWRSIADGRSLTAPAAWPCVTPDFPKKTKCISYVWRDQVYTHMIDIMSEISINNNKNVQELNHYIIFLLHSDVRIKGL
jgi:hypothetical protein